MRTEPKAPRFYRPYTGNKIGYEIYGWHCFFISISIRSFEIQLNRWGAI